MHTLKFSLGLRGYTYQEFLEKKKMLNIVEQYEPVLLLSVSRYYATSDNTARQEFRRVNKYYKRWAGEALFYAESKNIRIQHTTCGYFSHSRSLNWGIWLLRDKHFLISVHWSGMVHPKQKLIWIVFVLALSFILQFFNEIQISNGSKRNTTEKFADAWVSGGSHQRSIWSNIRKKYVDSKNLTAEK